MFEKEAEEYVEGRGKELFRKFYDNDLSMADLLKTCCIEFAIKNGIQWHDLRKDPNDLPKGHKVVLNQVGAQTTYDPDRGFLGLEGCGIRAWTDVPLFKE